MTESTETSNSTAVAVNNHVRQFEKYFTALLVVVRSQIFRVQICKGKVHKSKMLFTDKVVTSLPNANINKNRYFKEVYKAVLLCLRIQ